MQNNLFAEENRLNKLSKLGDSLEKLNVIEWEDFRPILNTAYTPKRGKTIGRPPYDKVLMFKVLVLQRLYNLSDEQTEYQINDRMSFMRFLGLSLGDRIPDAKTIWLFRDTLAKAFIAEALFRMFAKKLEKSGLVTHNGTIIDATFVDVPRQRNTREENETIKSGDIPEEWTEDTPKMAHKLAQKDVDARWTKKGDETHFGFKDHVKADAESKVITDYDVTDASVHDSNKFTEFLDESDKAVYADSAYAGKDIPESCESRVCGKGYRNKPLSDEQKSVNRKYSKIRSRIEHIFGFMTGAMHGITFRGIGMTRAKFNIGITNLIYNICRYSFLKRKLVCAG